jgi:excisionase family DNA binding protein
LQTIQADSTDKRRFRALTPSRRPDAWRVNDALRQLSISRATLYKMIKRGELSPVYLGGRTLVPDTEIMRLVGGVSRSA